MDAVFGAAFDTMDYLCGRPTFSREQPGPFSVRADPSRPVWTHASVGGGALLATPFPGCDTVYATFQYAVAKNGSRPAVGMRTLIKVRRTRNSALSSRCGAAVPRVAARRCTLRTLPDPPRCVRIPRGALAHVPRLRKTWSHFVLCSARR